MKAQNLTIAVPDAGCDANCPYCISKITWTPESFPGRFYSNLPKVVHLAETANVTNILITGKGEPFLNFDCIQSITSRFRDWPIEVQTNGRWLSKMFWDGEEKFIEVMNRLSDVNVIAFSISTFREAYLADEMYTALAKRGFIVRVCLNHSGIINADPSSSSVFSAVDVLSKVPGVRQVLIRNISVPSNADPENKAVKWIKEKAMSERYQEWARLFAVKMQNRIIRILPETGTPVFDYNGISVCFSDYCVQESNSGDDIRSLIYQQDGHVYTSWASPASVLF